MVFLAGYNRRSECTQKTPFKPVTLSRTGYVKPEPTTPSDSIQTKDKTTKPSNGKKLRVSKKKSPPLKEAVKHIPQTQESLVITRVHDPKNQLSSLVKNARKNMNSLNERNERIKKSKQQSRSRYGW
ncbi:similar to Tetrapisispora blattae TBLA_0D03710 hypothetical protein [Maudiozyma saulgeensis]|uniref:Uncharacterized protein n=1 Tax=Maudiozyma saulgeensis TaxID=1789683 RepID=A0A1X7R1J3_9SACH|nr:similar to Tetrapisispora blattae TBLA_0D03710 hypothetical protein [Kazachstania saulgeensis]